MSNTQKLSIELPNDWIPILRQAASDDNAKSVAEFVRVMLMNHPKMVAAWERRGRPTLSDPRRAWGGRRKKAGDAETPKPVTPEGDIPTTLWGKPDDKSA